MSHERRLLLVLHRSKELLLLVAGLEASVAELGGGVDELELDLLQRLAARLGHKGLPESHNTALDAAHLALDHDVVLVDLTVVGEPAKGCDALDSQVELGGSVVVDFLAAISAAHASSHLVDLLVELSTVMVTVLTGTCHSELDTRRMPGANAGNLAETL